MKIKQDKKEYDISQLIRELHRESGMMQKDTMERLQLLKTSMSCKTYPRIEYDTDNISEEELLALSEIFSVEFVDSLREHLR